MGFSLSAHSCKPEPRIYFASAPLIFVGSAMVLGIKAYWQYDEEGVWVRVLVKAMLKTPVPKAKAAVAAAPPPKTALPCRPGDAAAGAPRPQPTSRKRGESEQWLGSHVQRLKALQRLRPCVMEESNTARSSTDGEAQQAFRPSVMEESSTQGAAGIPAECHEGKVEDNMESDEEEYPAPTEGPYM